MKESEARAEVLGHYHLPWVLLCQCIRTVDETSFVHRPHEHLEANDGVDDNNEDD